MLRVRDLGLRIDGKALLRGVSFDVHRGESVTVIGPNGAGKTTLIRCLAGLLTPSEGEVILEGRELRAWRRRALAERIAYVPQSSGPMLPCSAYEFVLMARYAHFRRFAGARNEDKAAARDALAAAGVAELAGRAMNTLSGGQRQKVMIAAALAQEAPLLLLDEPATFLDYRHEAELIALVERLHRDAGRTPIIVSHDLNKGALESDRMLALAEGRVVFDGPPGEVASPERLEAVFGTPFDVIRHGATERRLVVPLRRAP
jgi:iron complex transport system ATP-binding protein